MNTASDTPGRRIPEWLFFLGFLVVWLGINLLTLTLSPTVWQDEVMFTDPAVNLLRGHGFCSTAWPCPRDVPVLLNGPLYSLLLAGWLHLWGIGITAVRSFNLFLTALTTLLAYTISQRRHWLPGLSLRLLALALLLCSTSISFSYRTGRYDILGILLTLSIVFILTPPVPSRPRFFTLLLILLGALGPFAGLYLLPYWVLLSTAYCLWRRHAALHRLVPLFAGIFVGCAAFALLHTIYGTWPYLHHFIRDYRGPTLPLRVAQALPDLRRHHSLLLTLLALAVLRIPHWLSIAHPRLRPSSQPGGAFAWRCDPFLIALFTTLTIPLYMAALAKFPLYYGWMITIPVVLCLLQALRLQTRPGTGIDRIPLPHPLPWQRTSRILAGIFLFGAVSAGLPMRTILALLQHPQRDYSHITQFTAAQARSSDWALADYETYYATLGTIQTAFFPPHFPYVSDADREQLTLLLLRPETIPDGIAVSGERAWGRAASLAAEPSTLPAWLPAARLYNLEAWRRSP